MKKAPVPGTFTGGKLFEFCKLSGKVVIVPVARFCPALSMQFVILVLVSTGLVVGVGYRRRQIGRCTTTR